MAMRKFDPPVTPWEVEFTVQGEPASKANSRELVKIRGRTRFVKSKKALGYVQGFTLQCPTLDPLLSGDLLVAIEIYYATKRPDLDASVILDAMEGRIYTNDRQVKEQHLYWNLDRQNPRAIVRVSCLANTDS